MQKWIEWFKSIGDKIVEQVGLMNGKEISNNGEISELPFDLDAQTGYLIIDVESMDERL